MYFVYVMTNRSKTLYTGVTNNLMRRVREHKAGGGSRFTAKYKLDRLVYFERFEDVHNAIEREKAHQRLAANQENRPHRFGESILEGFARGMVRASSIPAAECLVMGV
jgi:predicted GIY-YIG superfamily endonuclease